jgi:hypothetical protein
MSKQASKTSKTATIKRAEVLAKLNEFAGGFVYIVFTSRKTGEAKSGLYTLNVRKYGRTGQGMAYDPATRNLVQVCDVHSARRRRAGVLNASGKPVADDRVLPLEGISLMRGTIDNVKITYTVTD